MRFMGRKQFLLFAFLLSLLLGNGLVPSVAAAAESQISAVHWSMEPDPATGQQKTHLVLDMSKPVSVESFITGVPTWRLVVTLKSVKPWKEALPASPDKTVVEKLSISTSGKEITRLILDLPMSLKENQYRVSTSAADTKQGKPFQVIIDVLKTKSASGQNFSAGLRNKLIAIDPGHGGSDPGAIGRLMGTREKTITLAISLQVKALLEQAGAKVAMTRTTDVDVSNPNASDREELQARASVGNDAKADIFLSIHINASRSETVGGTTTYYFWKSPYDSYLAQALQDNLLKSCGLSSLGTRTANFYVLKNTRMPAALVELAFISNPQEERILNSPDFQQKAALGIVKGLDDFFSQTAKMRGDD